MMIIPEIYRQMRDGDLSVRESYYRRREDFEICAREPLESLSPEAVEAMILAAVEERDVGVLRIFYRSRISDSEGLMRAFEVMSVRIQECIGAYARMTGCGPMSPDGWSVLFVSLFRYDEVPPERLIPRAVWEKALRDLGCRPEDENE